MFDTKHIQTIIHYAGILALVITLYFVGDALWTKHVDASLHGPVVTSTAPTPQPGVAAALQRIAEAANNKTLSDAIAGRAADLSMAQQTVANTIQAAGVSSRMAAALAAGLTAGTPKQQVIEVRTAATSTVTPPPVVDTDDHIKKDLKEVLADTTIKTQVNTSVDVKWEDKPFSPFFAAYTSDGASGVGFTVRKATLFNLDALVLRSTANSFQLGAGLEHIFKGTSAGVGVDAVYDIGTRKPKVGLFVGVHF